MDKSANRERKTYTEQGTVTRPEIAESMNTLEEKFKKWRKDVAYLKEIDAYDFGDACMVFLLWMYSRTNTEGNFNEVQDDWKGRSSAQADHGGG